MDSVPLLDGGHVGRAGYLNYITPGILLVTVAASVQGTAIVVAMDMTRGDHRPIPYHGDLPLCGAHWPRAGNSHPNPCKPGRRRRCRRRCRVSTTVDPVEWLATIGMILAFSFGLVWLAAALGLAAKSVETASNTPMFLTLLAVPRQRLRAGCLDASGLAAVRRVPTIHPDHRNCARTAHRDRNWYRKPSPCSLGASASRPPPTCGPDISTNTTPLDDQTAPAERGGQQ